MVWHLGAPLLQGGELGQMSAHDVCRPGGGDGGGGSIGVRRATGHESCSTTA